MPYLSTQTVSANNSPTNASMNATLKEKDMVPLGACVWTSSGKLANSGIKAIAQAASGAMGHFGDGFEPTRESVAACIENSFLLAIKNGHNRLAIPFIASGIFKDRIMPTIDKDELASLIVKSCQSYRDGVEAVIVAYDDTDMGHFQKAMKGNIDKGVTLMQCSITNYDKHKCAAIVNAANMEVEFGDGISGIIGKATGEKEKIKINEEAKSMIKVFWKINGS